MQRFPMKLPLAVFLALTSLCGGSSLLAKDTVVKPNVLLILSDDMGYGDIGVHGCKDIPTPHIDRIAARGVRFTNAYANGANCTPTRAALLSGQYPQRFGVEDLTNVTGPLPKSMSTLADRMRAAGYSTAMVGKWHLGADEGYTPLDRGFEHFFGFLGGGHEYLPLSQVQNDYSSPLLRGRKPIEEKRYLTDAFGEEASSFVASQQHETKPFFLYLAFNAVHTPMQAPQKYIDRFLNIEDPQRRTYAAMLSAMDDAIGRVIGQLERAGKLNTTLVIFHNDNGGPPSRNGSSNSPLRGAKASTYEGGIRVPLLMQWPQMLDRGAVYDQPVITMDLTATLVAVAGANAKNIDGVDLLPHVCGEPSSPPHDALYWRNRMKGDIRAVRQGKWKYVYSTPGVKTPSASDMPASDRLFDLDVDAAEQHDLSRNYPEKLAELKRQFDAWSAAVDADCRRQGIQPPQATP